MSYCMIVVECIMAVDSVVLTYECNRTEVSGRICYGSWGMLSVFHSCRILFFDFVCDSKLLRVK